MHNTLNIVQKQAKMPKISQKIQQKTYTTMCKNQKLAQMWKISTDSATDVTPFFHLWGRIPFRKAGIWDEYISKHAIISLDNRQFCIYPTSFFFSEFVTTLITLLLLLMVSIFYRFFYMVFNFIMFIFFVFFLLSYIFLTANADRRPWDSHWLNKGGGGRTLSSTNREPHHTWEA